MHSRLLLSIGAFGLAVLLSACAALSKVESSIEGRVLLEGLPSGQLAGTQIVLNGFRITYTNNKGDFSFSGDINGPDDFELIISREGYHSMRIEGTLEYEAAADKVVVTKIGNVTLPKATKYEELCNVRE